VKYNRSDCLTLFTTHHVLRKYRSRCLDGFQDDERVD
jgi:hypothetical protein